MNAYVFFSPLFFLCLIKVIQSKCSQTCLLKPAWLYSLLADLQNKKLLVTADSYSTKHPRVLSPLSLSWAEFKAHQPLVCVTLIVPIRAEQGHTGHVSMMSVWEECGSTPLAILSTTQPSVLHYRWFIPAHLQFVAAALWTWRSFCPANWIICC